MWIVSCFHCNNTVCVLFVGLVGHQSVCAQWAIGPGERTETDRPEGSACRVAT